MAPTKKFSLLREGSTITPNRALAEAFSHKPPILSCEADGTLLHNGKKYGYLYCNRRTDRRGARSVPASAHNTGARLGVPDGAPLRVRWVADVGKPGKEERKTAKRRLKGLAGKRKT